MRELARNRQTGTVHVAAELPFSPELDTGGWECPGCGVEMIPVATGSDQQYKVAPHFASMVTMPMIAQRSVTALAALARMPCPRWTELGRHEPFPRR